LRKSAVLALETRIAQLESSDDGETVATADRAIWDWNALSCPCGLPPGDCHVHPRARTSQRPPAGDWRVWAYVAGRGAGKTRAGAGWVQRRVEDGTMKIGCLIAPTTSDIRDVMVEGQSGLIAVAPPWCRPRFEPSKRRIVWPGGARAVCLSGEEPERARGLNIDTLWADELACWQRAESTWDLAMLALRAGTNPQSLITTTPRRLAVLRRILAEPTTVRTTDTTYANQAHLPPQFINQIVGLYEHTRLGRQEIYAEFLETSEGVWFANFDPARHVSMGAEFHPGYPVRCAIDAGTSRHTAAVFFQVRDNPTSDRPRVTVFADYHALDVVSLNNARAIKELAHQLPCQGRIDSVRLDPAATARSSLGPAAYGEYERVFGSRILSRWPHHLVLDGLDTIELLLETGNLTIHPRCTRLNDAFRNYCRQRRRGEWIDSPADNHPEEDLIDAIRGGIRDALPASAALAPGLRQVHASGILH
jgi:phage terminase large subunit-like protein